MRVIELEDTTVRITEDLVDDFFKKFATGDPVSLEESPYLDAREAAIYLKTTVKGIYGLIERGRLQALPGSRKLLFTKEMLDELLRGN